MYTYPEYLVFEETSDIRHEYFEGTIRPMAVSPPNHSSLAAAVLAIVRQQLPRGCRAFTCNLRVRIPATGLSTYPDVTVVCGSTQPAPDDRIAITNPVVLVEVTSNSTEEYDRGEKLQHYQAIPTVQEVLIVSHREPRLTLHRRDEQRWTAEEATAGETIRLQAIGALLDVDDLYRDGLEDAPPRG